MEATINQLMEMTGKSFRTIKAKISSVKPVREDGRASHYSCREVLPIIYGTTDSAKIAEDMAKESLLLERSKREKSELEVQKLRGEVAEVATVAKEVSAEYTIVRAKLRTIPTRMAKPLSLETDAQAVFNQLSDVVEECLAELSADEKYKRELDAIESARASFETRSPDDASTVTETESGGMGGHVPVPES